jgi:cytochrome c biogenesis protein CcdA
MMPIEQMLVTLPMALALGLVYGLSACTVSCLPYLGPVFLASDGGIRRSWRIMLPFSLGRLLSYATLASAAGMAGHYLGSGIADGQVRPVVGVAALLIGLSLLWRRPPASRCRPSGDSPRRRIERRDAQQALMPSGLFLLGASMALNPCAPLGTVLFSAAATASALHGLALGLSFGTGAIVIPSLVYGIGFAYFSRRLRGQLQQHRLTLERLSGLLLILTGAGNLLR